MSADLQSLWSAVERALEAAEALSHDAPAPAAAAAASSTSTSASAQRNGTRAAAAAANLANAIAAASAALAATATPDAAASASAAAAAADALSESAALSSLLQTQLQALSSWSARNAQLSASVSAAQRVAPRISSFAAARAEAAAAVAAASSGSASAAGAAAAASCAASASDKALKAARTALSTIQKLGGLVVLGRVGDVEHTDEASGGMPCLATAATVCVRRSMAASSSNGNGGEDALYASEAAFARMIEAQQNAEAEYVVLQLLLLTPSQAAELDLLSSAPAAPSVASSTVSSAAIAGASDSASGEFSSCRLVRAEALGLVGADALAAVQSVYSARGAQEGSKALEAAMATAGAACPDSVHAAVARATHRALQNQKDRPAMATAGAAGALDTMLRDLAWEAGF